MSDATASIPRRANAGMAPLSFGQELFWLLDRATPGLTAYNVPRAFHIVGPLQAAALERTLQAIVDRHEVLRSVYTADGERPAQVVLTDARVPFERVDLGTLPPAARLAETDRLLCERSTYHFDLARDVLLRATLVRLGDDDHVLMFLTHHIAFDGWSKSVIYRELGTLYQAYASASAPDLALPRIQFGDYAAWERHRSEGPAMEESLRYWRDQLRGPLPVLELPTDRQPSTARTFDGDERQAVLPTELVRQMRALGQASGASLYMVLLAAYQTLLHRYSGQDDIVVGSPTAGRDHEDTHDAIGYFANALVLRTSFAGDPTFAELIVRVAGTCLDAYEHSDVPFEKLVLALQSGAQLTHAPLFQCVLTMEDTIPAALTLGSLRLEPWDVSAPVTKFDLVMMFSERADGVHLRLGYRTALFDADRIERMLGHLRVLLEAAVRDPATRVSALPLLTETERTSLRDAWNGPAWIEGEPSTLIALIEQQARRVPTQAAVVGDDDVVTWAELNGRANRIAHWLAEQGVGPDVTVGLCLDRNAALITGMLGVLKAGGAYVPLLPELPAARLAQQVTESGARIVVTTTAHRRLLAPELTALVLDGAGAVLAKQSDANLAARMTPASLAYVLFTSGSTGVPKGVAVTHANLVHYVRAIAQVIGLDLAGERVPWHFATVSTLGADLGHTAVFPALCSGGTLHVLSADVATDAARLADYVAAHPLDLLKITPNHLRALLAGRETGPLLPGRWLVLGGESCSWDLADMVHGSGLCRVLNHYGPTETTVGACTFEVHARASRRHSVTVPIGRPLANTRVYVHDANGELVPAGVPGELFIGGPGVARGYLGRDELTRERFVVDPYSPVAGSRLYRTGDRVRWLSTGDLEFIGRTDDQVKIRGFRVEPAEVGVMLQLHPDVRQAVVLSRPDATDQPRLIAWVAADARASNDALAAWLAERMPDYMVPAAWVRLDALPLTANGKVDRAALPDPDGTRDAPQSVAPRSATEATLLALWSEVLKRDVPGIHEDFFALGGHSLLAIRLLGKLSKAFGVRLPLRALFDAPTVALLADRLEPMSVTETQLAALFREVLRKDSVGRHDDFFALGGHSLLAIRLLGKISKQFGQRLPLRSLFDAPTVKQLSEHLARPAAATGDAP